MEAPAGAQGSAVVFTEEQQARLGVDAHGSRRGRGAAHPSDDPLDDGFEQQYDPLDANFEQAYDPLDAKFEAQQQDPLDAKFEAEYANKQSKPAADPLDAKFEAQYDPADVGFETQYDPLDANFEAQHDPLDAKFESQFADQDAPGGHHPSWKACSRSDRAQKPKTQQPKQQPVVSAPPGPISPAQHHRLHIHHNYKR
jgi:hypothetical protein